MVVWIVIGVVVLGLVVLALSAGPVLGRLPELERAVRRLLLKQEQAERLQVAAEALQQRVETVAAQAEQAAGRVEAIKAGRHPGRARMSFPAR